LSFLFASLARPERKHFLFPCSGNEPPVAAVPTVLLSRHTFGRSFFPHKEFSRIPLTSFSSRLLLSRLADDHRVSLYSPLRSVLGFPASTASEYLPLLFFSLRGSVDLRFSRLVPFFPFDRFDVFNGSVFSAPPG